MIFSKLIEGVVHVLVLGHIVVNWVHRLLAIGKNSKSLYLKVFRLLVYAVSQDKRYTEDIFINVHQ